MRFLSLLALVSALNCFAPLAAAAAMPPSPAPATTPTPVPPPAAVVDLSTKIIAAMTAGKVDRTLFSARFNSLVGDDAVAQIAPQLAALGKLQSITYAKSVPGSDYPVYVYVVKYDKATVREIIGLDKAGKVDSWSMRP
ncbi:MAG: hypothetical protein ABR584_06950 [Candidatus Baltobacteraceae bacterium]